MPVLAHAPPGAPPPRLPTSKLSATSLTQPVDMDDLLAETLAEADSPGLAGERDYTDDLEDIVSMSVAQQLHSRRSHSQMQTYLPSSPPLTATISPPLPAASPRFSPSPSHSASETEDLSASRSSVLNRSPSSGAARGGKRRPSAIPRPGGGSAGGTGRGSRTPSPELGRRKGSLPLDVEVQRTPSREPDEAEKWETLQVGAPTLGPAVGGTKRKAQSVSPTRPGVSAAPNATRPNAAKAPKPTTAGGMSRSKTVDFPGAAASSSAPSNLGSPAGTPVRGRPRPSAGSASKPSPSSVSSTPRKRAQTQTAASTLSNGTSSSPSTASPSATKSRPPANRTQTSTTPASSSPSSRARTGPPPARRKSLSTTQELASLRARAGADPLTSATLPSAAPEWSLGPAPLVYRTSRGDLAFGKEAEAEMRRRGVGREEAIVPAVARRLEAERLAALQAQGKSGAEEEGVLVSEWGPDGRPRAAVDWQGRRVANGQAHFAEGGGEGGTPPSVEPAQTPPPSAALPPQAQVDEQQQQPCPSEPPPHPVDPNDPSALDAARRGSVPFQAYLPPRSSSHNHSPAPSTPRQQHHLQQPISLDPAPAAAATATERQRARPTAQADAQAHGKSGGCCRCVVS